MQKKILPIFVILYLISLSNLHAQIDTVSEEKHELSNYHLAIFTGFTSNMEHNATDFTLGLDYEQRLPFLDRMFGVGLIIEGVFAEYKENILLIPIIMHLSFANIKLFLSPGVIFGERAIEQSNFHSFIFKKEITLNDNFPKETESYREFLFRIGLGYDLHYKMFSISPAVAFDFYNGITSIVWGLSFGLNL